MARRSLHYAWVVALVTFVILLVSVAGAVLGITALAAGWITI